MRLVGIFAAAAFAAGALAVATDASAQRNRNNAASVVVFDDDRVLAESNAGRGIASGLQAVGQQINQELQALGPERQSLMQEEQRVQQATRNMSAEQRRNNSQYQALAQRAQQFQTRQAQLQGDMECTRVMALRAFGDQLRPILQQVMESRGAGVVLSRGSVAYHGPQVDVTNDVLQRVNASIPAITVTRRPYTECVQQQQSAQ